jgi:hypothetical protein
LPRARSCELQRRPTPARPPNPQRRGARRAEAALEAAPLEWPAALLQHPAVCEDPDVLLRLLATGRALGDDAAAAAEGRLRLTLGADGDGEYHDDQYDDERRCDSFSVAEDEARRRLCRSQAAFVERHGELLSELAVVDGAWHRVFDSDHDDRPIERVLAPALRRAAAAGRLGGLRAVEAPSFGLEGGMLRALALCTALTRLSLGETTSKGCYAYAGSSPESQRDVGGLLAALGGLRELGFGFGCEHAAATALAGLSALTRLTRLRLALAGAYFTHALADTVRMELTSDWSGLHALPASLLDLTLAATRQVRGGSGPGRGLLHVVVGSCGPRQYGCWHSGGLGSGRLTAGAWRAPGKPRRAGSRPRGTRHAPNARRCPLRRRARRTSPRSSTRSSAAQYCSNPASCPT